MKTFCARHGPKNEAEVAVRDPTCMAGCWEKIHRKERTIVSPCCGRRYHSACVQEMAVQSGLAHFKCPMCANKEKFTKCAIKMGIYVPEQDASWERREDEHFYNFEGMGKARIQYIYFLRALHIIDRT